MAGIDLSEELIEAGADLLAITDSLDMQAQGAMWVLDHALGDWRYYLVTSLVDTIGRRKTYKLLIDSFEKFKLPDSITVEDVHLGSPSDIFFQLISSGIAVAGAGRAYVENCVFNGVPFDGVIYRSVMSSPTKDEARRIEKRFGKRVRELVKA
ncbi:hypothetical protein [Methylocystis sp.]|uniref:hypothetical protein n=1 Tax=Methylocystis sp. TaxID=1911079 RepID=UPI003DA4969C